MPSTEHQGREFEVLQLAAELLDTLNAEQQRQAMAMLAARYNLKLVEPTTQSRGNYRPGFKRKPRVGS
jgi:hypothetical protein